MVFLIEANVSNRCNIATFVVNFARS